MSSRHNRRKRRQAQAQEAQDAPPQVLDTDIPVLVERIMRESGQSGQSYEEANWAKLSPAFRSAHNRLRQARGLPPIPPPKIDLYVAPRGPVAAPFDPSNKEFVASACGFLGPVFGPRGGEGFTINGKEVR